MAMWKQQQLACSSVPSQLLFPLMRSLPRYVAVVNLFMKQNLKQLFLIGAASLLLAGCCTAHHVARWEYKVVRQNRVGLAYADFAKTQESLMNDLAREGWIFVSQSEQTLCFKRPVR